MYHETFFIHIYSNFVNVIQVWIPAAGLLHRAGWAGDLGVPQVRRPLHSQQVRLTIMAARSRQDFTVDWNKNSVY